jgi:hypothetical protein
VKVETAVSFVSVLVDVVHAAGVKTGRATLDAVDLVSSVEKKLGKVRSVLAGDAGD